MAHASSEAASSDGTDRPEYNVSFDFSLPWRAVGDYEIGAFVRSPVVVVGNCPVCLKIYPRGTPTAAGNYLSAFMEVCPEEDWNRDWIFNDVEFEIMAANNDRICNIPKRDTFAFKREYPDRGWHDMIKSKGLRDLERDGWVSRASISFRLKVWGSSLGNMQRKRLRHDHGERMWQDMRFTDMLICNDQDSVALRCHRAVLAASSEVFDRMLCSSMKEGVEKRLVLPNVPASSLKCFLEFIYTGSMPEESLEDLANIEEMLKLADQYNFSHLAKLCADSLVRLMQPATVSTVLRLLNRYSRLPPVGDRLSEAKVQLKTNPSLLDAVVACL